MSRPHAVVCSCAQASVSHMNMHGMAWSQPSLARVARGVRGCCVLPRRLQHSVFAGCCPLSAPPSPQAHVTCVRTTGITARLQVRVGPQGPPCLLVAPVVLPPSRNRLNPLLDRRVLGTCSTATAPGRRLLTPGWARGHPAPRPVLGQTLCGCRAAGGRSLAADPMQQWRRRAGRPLLLPRLSLLLLLLPPPLLVPPPRRLRPRLPLGARLAPPQTAGARACVDTRFSYGAPAAAAPRSLRCGWR